MSGIPHILKIIAFYYNPRCLTDINHQWIWQEVLSIINSKKTIFDTFM